MRSFSPCWLPKEDRQVWLRCKRKLWIENNSTSCWLYLNQEGVLVKEIFGHSSQIHQIHVKSKILKSLRNSFRFYGHFKDFSCWIWWQDVIWNIFRVPIKVRKLNKNIGFWGMRTLPGLLLEKLNFKFVINSKADFSGGQKHKKLHFDTKFHTFGSPSESNNFKTCF